MILMLDCLKQKCCFLSSEAILKYLCTSCDVPDHWYPAGLQQRSKIDEYLAWHHTNLRMGAGTTVRNKV